MKNYTMPEMEVTYLNNEDVITASGGLVIANFKPAENEEKKFNEINNF